MTTLRRCFFASFLGLAGLLVLAGPAAAQATGSGSASGSSAGGSLASTGSDTSVIVLAAIALLVVGATALIISRRRVRPSSL